MKKIDLVLSKLSKGIEWIMVLALGAMVIAMFAQVVLRYVFGTGFPWTEELARFLLIYMIFLGTVVLVHEDSQISITVLDEVLSGTSLKVLKIFQNLVGLAYSILVTKIGFGTLNIVSKQKSPNMRIDMDKIYMIIPISCILMAVHLVFKLIRMITNNNEMEGQN